MSAVPEQPVLVIEPGIADRNYWRDLWRYRELFYVLAWRDVAVRYKQTSLGVLWALLQPALMMLLFTLVMGRFAPAAWPGESYSLFVLCGLVPWQLVSYALTNSASSLVSAEAGRRSTAA